VNRRLLFPLLAAGIAGLIWLLGSREEKPESVGDPFPPGPRSAPVPGSRSRVLDALRAPSGAAPTSSEADAPPSETRSPPGEAVPDERLIAALKEVAEARRNGLAELEKKSGGGGDGFDEILREARDVFRRKLASTLRSSLGPGWARALKEGCGKFRGKDEASFILVLCADLEPERDEARGAGVDGNGGLPPRHFLEDLALEILEGGEEPDPFAAHYLYDCGSEKTARRARELLEGRWARHEGGNLNQPGPRARLYALLDAGGSSSAARYYFDRCCSESESGKRWEYLSLLFDHAGPETMSWLEPVVSREPDPSFRAAILCTAAKISHEDGREVDLLRRYAKSDPDEVVRKRIVEILIAKITREPLAFSGVHAELLDRSERPECTYFTKSEVAAILQLGTWHGWTSFPSPENVQDLPPSADGSRAVLDPLEDLVRTDPSAGVRLAAVSAIGEIPETTLFGEKQEALHRRLVADVEAAAGDPSAEVRAKAKEILERIRTVEEALREGR
jgi:hypothetical protein